MHGMFLIETQIRTRLQSQYIGSIGSAGEKAQTFLAKYQEKRPEVKKTSDYEKVARHHQGRFTLWSNQGRTAND